MSTVLGAAVKGEKLSPDRPAAGKSGTQQWGDSSDNQDAWMVGYPPDLAAAVWVGKATPGPIRDAAGKPIEGRTLPGHLWQDFVTAAPPSATPTEATRTAEPTPTRILPSAADGPVTSD